MGRQLRTVRSGLGSAYGVPMVSATTGATKVSIENYGVTQITSGANTWTLQAPEAGCIKYLVSLAVSSAARVVQLSSDGAASVKVGNEGATRITFNSTVAQTVMLLGINSTQWVCVSASPETAAVNSTGIVFGTS